MSDIRELAMRLVAEVSQSEALAYQRDSTIMLCPDGVGALVRAAMREAYKRADGICNAYGFASTAGEAIRAEADKLEGK